MDSRLRGNDGIFHGNDRITHCNDGVTHGNDGIADGNDGVSLCQASSITPILREIISCAAISLFGEPSIAP
jgi:hypothetical protein